MFSFPERLPFRQSSGCFPPGWARTERIFLCFFLLPIPARWLPPPALWLKADAGATVNNDGVSYWRDQSGNNHHAFQSQSGARPNLQEDFLNFNPVLNFDGGDEYMHGFAGFSTQTFFIVAHNDESFSDDDDGQTLLSYGDNGNNAFALGNTTGLLEGEFVTFAIRTASENYRSGRVGAGFISADPHLFVSWRSDQDSEPRQVIQVNGQNIVNREYNRDNYSWQDDQKYVLGAKRHSAGTITEYFNGKIAEVIAFDAALSKFDRAKVQSYLALKYGLTLDQRQADVSLRAYYDADANIVWEPARTPGFDQDIAGIGLDANSTLNQPKSKSSNNDALVTIGSPTDMTQGEFLIWANNGADIAFSATGGPEGYRILERRWKVQETGEVGAVSVAGLGSHFIIDREGDGFADNTPTPIGTPVNLNEGDEFTFLTENFEPCGAPGGVDANLVAWLRADADVSTTAAGGVSYWKDQSGNEHDLVQSNTSRQPGWSAESINFNPSVDFDGNAGSFSRKYQRRFLHRRLLCRVYFQRRVLRRRRGRNDDWRLRWKSSF